MESLRPTVRGYAAMEKGQELEPFEYEPPELGVNDVRIAITHCGLCYTDVHAIDDYYEITEYPFVPGHEVVGHVSEVGPAVTGLKIGDRVGVGWQGRSCGQCVWCEKGEEHLCRDVEKNGTWTPYGGFSTSISVDSDFVYPLPDGLPSEAAAVLLCAGITVFSPLREYATGASKRVGIIGVGGLGHLAIQFAHALGCEVTAISSSPGKEKEALDLGADRFLPSGDLHAIWKSGINFDLVLYTAHADIDWTAVLWDLENNGRLVMLGFCEVPVRFEPLDLVVHQLSITGSFIGSRSAMREMLQLAEREGIEPMVELMPMNKVNEAIERLKENRAHYRIVLVNE